VLCYVLLCLVFGFFFYLFDLFLLIVLSSVWSCYLFYLLNFVTCFINFNFFCHAPLPRPAYPIDERSSAKVVFTAALAGALASGSTTFTLHPLDTLKTRLQVEPPPLPPLPFPSVPKMAFVLCHQQAVAFPECLSADLAIP
jgi:hypothetical protein